MQPTLLNGCARAATADEAKFRIDRPIAGRSARVVALDEAAAAIVRRVAEQPWRDARFLVYEAPAAGGANGASGDIALRATDGSRSRLLDELTGADVALVDPPDTYANVAQTTYDAITAYADDVRSGRQIRGGIPVP